MKFLKVFFMSVVVLISLIVLGLFIFIKTFNLDQYREKIAQEISREINRQVELGKLSLSLSFSGVKLEVNGFSIEEREGFGIARSVSVEKILLDLETKPFFSRREIVVAEVLVQRPVISIVRNADGIINLQELAQPSSSSTTVSEASPNEDSTVKPAPKSSQPVDFFVKKVSLTDAEIIFYDNAQNPPVVIPINDFDVDIDGFSLNRSFTIKANAAILSQSQNISFVSTVSIDALKNSVYASQALLSVDLSSMDVHEMVKHVPAIKQAQMTSLSGKLTLDVYELAADASGIQVLAAQAKILNGEVVTSIIPTALRGISFDAKISPKDIMVTRASVNIGSGLVDSVLVIEDYLASPKYQGSMNLNQFLIQELIPKGQIPAEVQGVFNAKLQFEGAGFDPSAVKALVVAGTSQVTQGKIIGVNVLKDVLGKIQIIPNLYEKIISAFPPERREQLESPDTVFEKITANFNMKEGLLNITPLEVLSNGFSLQSQAAVNLDMDLTWQGEMSIPEDLSASMEKAVVELAYLKDEEGKIYFPLRPYQGKADKFITYPDLEYIGKKIVVKKGEDELRKVINKALGFDDEATNQSSSTDAQSEPGSAQSADPNQPAESPERVIINNVLDAIFKK
jgi:hypothetical protein